MMAARSYSQISLYERCPRQFNLRYNEQLPTPKSQQASRGTEIHESVEQYLLGEITTPHPEISTYHPWLKELKDEGARPEQAFCFNLEWEPVDWKCETAYVRGYIDAVLEDDDGLCIYEFKTGGIYEDHAHQRHLYGLAAMVLYPQYPQVEVISVYFDKHETVSVEYQRSMLNTYKYMWMQRIDKLNVDPHFAARPGPYCNWCPFSRKKGGPCEFGS